MVLLFHSISSKLSGGFTYRPISHDDDSGRHTPTKSVPALDVDAATFTFLVDNDIEALDGIISTAVRSVGCYHGFGWKLAQFLNEFLDGHVSMGYKVGSR